jgi:hypothetical protein
MPKDIAFRDHNALDKLGLHALAASEPEADGL